MNLRMIFGDSGNAIDLVSDDTGTGFLVDDSSYEALLGAEKTTNATTFANQFSGFIWDLTIYHAVQTST
jgi:hypothetical protein